MKVNSRPVLVGLSHRETPAGQSAGAHREQHTEGLLACEAFAFQQPWRFPGEGQPAFAEFLCVLEELRLTGKNGPHRPGGPRLVLSL